MQTRDLILKAFNGIAFIKLEDTDAKDLEGFQEIFKRAQAAEEAGLLDQVFSHTDPASGLIDLIYLTGATDLGRSKASEPEI